MKSLVDYLSTWFISDEDIATHQKVADAQQQIADRQYADGTLGTLDYWLLSDEIGNAGNYLGDYKAENDNPLRVVPWWLWVGGIVAVFWYLGGFTYFRGILAKR